MHFGVFFNENTFPTLVCAKKNYGNEKQKHNNGTLQRPTENLDSSGQNFLAEGRFPHPNVVDRRWFLFLKP